MSVKADQTKRLILETAANLINIKGYAATSIGDITQVTGLTKGAVYSHFKDKDDLAAQAFDYNFKLRFQDLSQYLGHYNHPVEKLLALLTYYRTDFVIKFWNSGGCPVINAGVELDDQYPNLRAPVMKAMYTMRLGLTKLLDEAALYSGTADKVNTQHYAYVIFCAIQGAIQSTKTSGDTSFLHHTLDELEKLIKREILLKT